MLPPSLPLSPWPPSLQSSGVAFTLHPVWDDNVDLTEVVVTARLEHQVFGTHSTQITLGGAFDAFAASLALMLFCIGIAYHWPRELPLTCKVDEQLEVAVDKLPSPFVDDENDELTEEEELSDEDLQTPLEVLGIDTDPPAEATKRCATPAEDEPMCPSVPAQVRRTRPPKPKKLPTIQQLPPQSQAERLRELAAFSRNPYRVCL